MPQQNQKAPTLNRSPGLPPENAEGHYFAFDQQGRVWALQWSADHGCFTAVGWDGRWPSTLLLKGDAAAQIVSHVEEPVSTIGAAPAE